MSREAEQPERVGEVLGHFAIRARLGESGAGVVYEADDLELGRRVALKVLAGDEQRRERFLREARDGAAVLHPNLTTVFEVGEANGLVFIAMELVAGPSLREVLQAESPLSRARAIEVAAAIARGLAAAHARGIVHGALTSERVIIAGDGAVKVLDLGSATATSPVAELDPRDDLESLRAMIKAMLPANDPLLVRIEEDRTLDGGAIARELERKPSRRRWVLRALAIAAAGSIAGSIIFAARAECTSDDSCASGRCAFGACKPWAGHLDDPQFGLLDHVALSPSGELFAGGFISGTADVGCGPVRGGAHRTTTFVAKFSRRGECLWSNAFSLDGSSGVHGLAARADGHLWVSIGLEERVEPDGTVIGKSVLIELDEDGRRVAWKRFAWGPMGIALGPDSEVVLGGQAGTSSIGAGGSVLSEISPASALVIKLTPNGDPVWGRGFGEGRDFYAWVMWTAVAPNGDVAIYGSFRGRIDERVISTGKKRDHFLIVLSGADGTTRWMKHLATPEDDTFEGGVVFDASGDLFVTGQHQGLDLGGGKLPGTIFAARFEPGGALVWARGFGGELPRDGARRVAIDPSGDPIIFGRVSSPSVAFDELTVRQQLGSAIYVARLDRATGRVVNVRSFEGSDATARGLAIDRKTRNVVVGGRFEGSLTFGDQTVYTPTHDGYFASVGAL